MGSTPNEKALCEAVIQLVEEDLENSRSGFRRCDDDQIGPPVDCRFRVGERSFAIEHTIAESFPDQIALETRFLRFVDGMEGELRGMLPLPGIYDLKFDIAPTENHRPSEHGALRREIIGWCRSAAAELYAEFPFRGTRRERPHHRGVREATIDGVRVWLERRVTFSDRAKHDGLVFIGRLVSKLEQARQMSMAKAMNEKLDKLARCALEDGDETFLVLENQDAQLGNHIAIAYAVEPLLETRADWPDVIFVGDTCTGDTWSLWPIIRNGKMALETCDHVDFDAAKLLATSALDTS